MRLDGTDRALPAWALLISATIVGGLHAWALRRRSVAVEQIYNCAFNDGAEYANHEAASWSGTDGWVSSGGDPVHTG